jgi:hypothetical protein
MLRRQHFRHIISAAGFDQQNAHAGILCKSARQGAPGRSRATHDEVVTLWK